MVAAAAKSHPMIGDCASAVNVGQDITMRSHGYWNHMRRYLHTFTRVL